MASCSSSTRSRDSELRLRAAASCLRLSSLLRWRVECGARHAHECGARHAHATTVARNATAPGHAAGGALVARRWHDGGDMAPQSAWRHQCNHVQGASLLAAADPPAGVCGFVKNALFTTKQTQESPTSRPSSCLPPSPSCPCACGRSSWCFALQAFKEGASAAACASASQGGGRADADAPRTGSPARWRRPR
jgi:hypothetical protein